MHLADGRMQHMGHALAAIIRVAVHAGPSALAQGVECRLEAGRRAHDPVLQYTALVVANLIERCQHVAGDLAGLFQNGAGEFAIQIGIAFDRAFADLQNIMQDK